VSALLPLFPLDVVLLPGTALPLHIFEPRYKEMIAECRAQKSPFGVVRAKEEGVAEIGCTAEIVGVAKDYADGRMDILTEGRRRFEVMEVNPERSFLRAEVLYLEDEPTQASAEQIEQAVALHAEIAGLAEAESSGPLELQAPQLSFQLAGTLPLDLDFKQTLLGMKSEAERVPAIVSYFAAILPGLRHAVRARQRAGGNGHVH
jgi:Lon protease-like protein